MTPETQKKMSGELQADLQALLDDALKRNRQLEVTLHGVEALKNGFEDELNSVRKERDDLKGWKESQLQVDSEWNPQKIGRVLNLPAGANIRASLMPEIQKLIRERDEAQAKCVSFLFTIETLVCRLSEIHEIKTMSSVQTQPSDLSILNNDVQREEDTAKQMQEMSLRNNEGEMEKPRVPKTPGRIMAQEKEFRQGKIQEIPRNLQKEASTKIHGGLSETRSLQVSMQDNATQCGCVGEGGEAKDMSRMWVGRMPSCSSPRLQQAIQRSVDLQYLSREEAQKILENISANCGKGWVRVEELQPAIEVLSGCAITFHMNGTYPESLKIVKRELSRLEKLTENSK